MVIMLFIVLAVIDVGVFMLVIAMCKAARDEQDDAEQQRWLQEWNEKKAGRNTRP